MSHERTLILNTGYQVVGVIPWKDAVTLLYQEKAEWVTGWDGSNVVYDREVSNPNRKYCWHIPAILRLVDNNVFPRHKRIKFSKMNILYRDDHVCQYCGYKQETHSAAHKSKRLTIDHVIPQCKGGETSFLNCVAACQECNSKKADMSAAEAGMKLLRKPFVPSVMTLMNMKLRRKQIHSSWEPYLASSPNASVAL